MAAVAPVAYKPSPRQLGPVKRVLLELDSAQSLTLKAFRNLEAEEDDLLNWHALLMPEHPPYNKGAFKIDFCFPIEYPFKPIKVFLQTRIYHPNINTSGQICLPIIFPEFWKPATRTTEVIQSLIAIIHDPQPEYPMRPEVVEEFVKDRKKFMRKALEYTKKCAEKRPRFYD